MALAFGGISAVSTSQTPTSVAVSGSDTVGFISVNGDSAASNSITAVTWGGVSMTLLAEVRIPSSRWHSVWYIANPSSGAAISFTGGSFWRSFSYYYTGAKQTGIPDSSNTGTQASATTISVATTVVASNSWVVMSAAENGGGRTSTPSNALTIARATADAGGIGVLDSNGTVATGSQTATITNDLAATAIAAIVFSIAPAVAAPSATTGSGAFILMGVGT